VTFSSPWTLELSWQSFGARANGDDEPDASTSTKGRHECDPPPSLAAPAIAVPVCYVARSISGDVLNLGLGAALGNRRTAGESGPSPPPMIPIDSGPCRSSRPNSALTSERCEKERRPIVNCTTWHRGQLKPALSLPWGDVQIPRRALPPSRHPGHHRPGVLAHTRLEGIQECRAVAALVIASIWGETRKTYTSGPTRQTTRAAAAGRQPARL
jgi:hypothetical protein